MTEGGGELASCLCAPRASLQVAGSDPLCRPLTAGEQQWLAQSSLICLVARLSLGLSRTFDAATLVQHVASTAAKNPFLCVGINGAASRFVRNSGVTVTSETLDEDSLLAVRAATQRQLQLGIDRAVCMARVHLLQSPADGVSHLVLIADHVCIDGKSLLIWLDLLVVPPVSDADPMHAFVDWTDLVPRSATFSSPFQSPVESIKLSPKVPSTDLDLADMVVADVVATLDVDTFASLRSRTKEKGTTLNTPLMAAFLAGMADVALKQMAGDERVGPGRSRAVDVRSVCAVDLRAKLGLPPTYMNNSSAVVPVHASFERTEASDAVDGTQLWPAALAAQTVMLDHIEQGEAFRLHDITRRGAFAEFGPYFDILCLWSNMGAVQAKGIEACEVHLRGAASNPIISGHPVTADGVLTLTLTFSPAHHSRETVEFAASRFVHHIGLLATA